MAQRLQFSKGMTMLATEDIQTGIERKYAAVGRSRLEGLVALHSNDSAQEVVNSVFAQVTRHSRGMATFDDQSLIVIRALVISQVA